MAAPGSRSSQRRLSNNASQAYHRPGRHSGIAGPAARLRPPSAPGCAACTSRSSRARAAARAPADASRSCARWPRFDGHAPASYRLDAAVNWLPDALPADFPHGSVGLRFAHAGGELVALPNGWGFSL